jgi:ribosome biogenesis GTPase A
LVDFDKAARLIIKDWNDGKIKYFTNPPFFEGYEDKNLMMDG